MAMFYEQHPPPQHEPPDGGDGIDVVDAPTDENTLRSRTVAS